jgi:beta-1,4-mannosyl-glycoprotein beta-1,4-N-acetylglucosaminyltransferase
MKKHKIIDTIFFYDEIDMLIFRLSELNEHVDQFIVMEAGIDFLGNPKPLFFKENEHLFEKWKDKITYLSFENMSSKEFDELSISIKEIKIQSIKLDRIINRQNVHLYLLTILYHYLRSSDLYFEDLIMVSDVDEIPDLTKLPEINDKIIFSCVYLRQKNFIWSTDFISSKPNLGTICCQFTTIITSPSIFMDSWIFKNTSNIQSLETVDSGYHFSHFYDIEKTKKKLKLINPSITEFEIKNSWDNLVSIPTVNDKKSYRLSEYFGELPKNIHLLKNQPIGREYPKNHLIIINSNAEVIEDKFSSFTDLIYLVNFTNDPKVSYKIKLSDKISQYNILIPNSKYYDILIEENTFENFQKMFGVNEISEIISTDMPLSKDLFTFFNNENPDNLITIPWSELREGFIYDKISEIL